MILLDANVLLYAYDSTSPFYPKLSAWIEEILSGPEEILIPWVTIWAFVRVRTNPVMVQNPATSPDSFEIIRSWLRTDRVRAVHPGPRHVEILEHLVLEYGIRGAKLSDAALAALAMEYGAAVASTDHDFSRFDQIRWINPLKVA